MNHAKPLKVRIMERSLTCFACGLLGLIPILGVPLAVVALQEHWRVKHDGAGMWNPARRYLKWGVICGRLGLVVSLIVVSAIAVMASHDLLFGGSE